MKNAEQIRADRRARQDAWMAHWKANHVWTVDENGVTRGTPKPGWCWAREREIHVFQGRS